MSSGASLIDRRMGRLSLSHPSVNRTFAALADHLAKLQVSQTLQATHVEDASVQDAGVEDTELREEIVL